MKKNNIDAPNPAHVIWLPPECGGRPSPSELRTLADIAPLRLTSRKGRDQPRAVGQYKVICNAVHWNQEWTAAAVYALPGKRRMMATLVVATVGAKGGKSVKWSSVELCRWPLAKIGPI